MARRISVALLGVGAALMWPMPLGGALVMLTGALGLAMVMEDDLINEGLIPVETLPPRPVRLDDAA